MRGFLVSEPAVDIMPEYYIRDRDTDTDTKALMLCITMLHVHAK